MTTLELTISTLVSENQAVHENLSAWIQRLETRGRREQDALSGLAKIVDEEVETLRRMIVDLREWVNQRDAAIATQIENVREELL